MDDRFFIAFQSDRWQRSARFARDRTLFVLDLAGRDPPCSGNLGSKVFEFSTAAALKEQKRQGGNRIGSPLIFWMLGTQNAGHCWATKRQRSQRRQLTCTLRFVLFVSLWLTAFVRIARKLWGQALWSVSVVSGIGDSLLIGRFISPDCCGDQSDPVPR